MSDREILETYSNSTSKNTSETDIFPHGPKSLLTSVIAVHKIKHSVSSRLKVGQCRQLPLETDFCVFVFEILCILT